MSKRKILCIIWASVIILLALYVVAMAAYYLIQDFSAAQKVSYGLIDVFFMLNLMLDIPIVTLASTYVIISIFFFNGGGKKSFKSFEVDLFIIAISFLTIVTSYFFYIAVKGFIYVGKMLDESHVPQSTIDFIGSHIRIRLSLAVALMSIIASAVFVFMLRRKQLIKQAQHTDN